MGCCATKPADDVLLQKKEPKSDETVETTGRNNSDSQGSSDGLQASPGQPITVTSDEEKALKEEVTVGEEKEPRISEPKKMKFGSTGDMKLKQDKKRKVSVKRLNSDFIVGETESIEDHYEIGQTLGEPGQFGQAYLVKCKKTGQFRACKLINKSKFKRKKDRMDHFNQLKGEIEIMKGMDHPNIIKFYEVFEKVSHVYIVMECCSGGELFDRIQKYPDGFSEKEAAGILTQILKGIKYMHDHKIAHCDLKPDNFLFLNEATDSPLKIIDFGMSKVLERREYLKAFRGTPYYIAPEVLQGKYAEHCDMWSFGVVMFVMLFGFPPFHGNSDADIFKKIQAGFNPTRKKGYGSWFPEGVEVSEDACDLIAKCLDMDTGKRFTAAEALEHKWLSDAPTKTLTSQLLQNLNEFVSNAKFKQAVLGVMSDYMTKDDIEQLGTLFKKIDLNGDGLICQAEMKSALENDQLLSLEGEAANKAVQRLLKMADVDGDGMLSYDELLNVSLHRKLREKEERLYEAFCRFDVDKNGTVSASEIANVIGVPLEEAEKFIGELDVNGDGEIDYEEFIDMWLNKENQFGRPISDMEVQVTVEAKQE